MRHHLTRRVPNPTCLLCKASINFKNTSLHAKTYHNESEMVRCSICRNLHSLAAYTHHIEYCTLNIEDLTIKIRQHRHKGGKVKTGTQTDQREAVAVDAQTQVSNVETGIQTDESEAVVVGTQTQGGNVEIDIHESEAVVVESEAMVTVQSDNEMMDNQWNEQMEKDQSRTVDAEIENHIAALSAQKSFLDLASFFGSTTANSDMIAHIPPPFPTYQFEAPVNLVKFKLYRGTWSPCIVVEREDTVVII